MGPNLEQADAAVSQEPSAGEPAGESLPSDSEDELDADQQQAFESIMAQIEGGDDSDDGSVSGEGA